MTLRLIILHAINNIDFMIYLPSGVENPHLQDAIRENRLFCPSDFGGYCEINGREVQWVDMAKVVGLTYPELEEDTK